MFTHQQQQQMARDLHALAEYKVRQPARLGRILVIGFLLTPFIGLLIGLASAARKALGW